jgi:hypothetical protein
MHDVTWRTGLTFTILALLVLLGSGRLVQPADPPPTAMPTGEGTRSASSVAGPRTPEAVTAQPARHDATLPAGAAGPMRVLRQPGGPAEIWR